MVVQHGSLVGEYASLLGFYIFYINSVELDCHPKAQYKVGMDSGGNRKQIYDTDQVKFLKQSGLVITMMGNADKPH